MTRPNPLTLAGIIPVVEIDRPEDVEPLTRALQSGGVRVLEITLRTAGALEAIRRASATPGMIVGAGTVLDTEQATAAVSAGARFVVSPGLDDDVVAHTQELGGLPVPGVATATELQRARRLGLRLVKVFPARHLGGPDFVAALSAPFPEMRFMPSGGVSIDNAASYAAVPSIAALGTSWAAPRELIRDRDQKEIARRCRAMNDLLAGPRPA